MWDRPLVGLASALLIVGAAAAQDGSALPHVRGEGEMRQLLADATRRSPAIQAWIERLDELDVTVYVRMRTFRQRDLDGRVALLAAPLGHRYLVIELAPGRSELTQMTTLAHELFHAIEIAEDPSAVTADALADLYGHIGRKTGDSGGLRTFETEAAAAAGLRARRELLTTTRHGNGT